MEWFPQAPPHGVSGGVSRNTLANANRRRDWRIYAAFAQELIAIARPLYAEEPLGLELDNTKVLSTA